MILDTILLGVSVLALAFTSSPPKPPPTPAPPPDTAAEDARAAMFADAQKRRGRRSTILTKPTTFGLNGSERQPTLPGAAYVAGTRSTLG